MKQCQLCDGVQPDNVEQCECGSFVFWPLLPGGPVTAHHPDERPLNLPNVDAPSQTDITVWDSGAPLPNSRRCPQCFCETDSLKTFRLTSILFALVFIQLTRIKLTACPRCMRAQLWHWGLLQILTAHILWPFFVLPNLVFRLLATLKRGHVEPKRTVAMGCLYAGVLMTGAVVPLMPFSLGVVLAEASSSAPALAVFGLMTLVPLILYALLCWIAINEEIVK